MTNLILTLIVCSTVITSIVNCMKPGYKKLTGKYAVSVSVLLGFALGILAAFSIAPHLWIELNVGLKVLLWLALGTGSNIFYDAWELIKGLGKKLNEVKEVVE